MDDLPLFPGQVERLEFSIEQIRSISSPARSEVFWTYRPSEPRSAHEIAIQMNRSAGTIHYHTNELVRVGLLVEAEQRRSGARTEKLYVWAGRIVYGRGHPMTDEYRHEAAKGFHAIMRAVGRERATLHRVLPEAPELGDCCIFTVSNLRLSREDARSFKAELLAVLKKYQEKEDPNGVRHKAVIVTHPEMGEMRKAYKANTGQTLRAEAETET